MVVVGLALAIGKDLLALIGGEDFESGAIILVPLAVAACFDLASVAFEPVLHSTDRARNALIARIIAVFVLACAIVALIHFGAVGAAWGVAIGGAAGYVAMGAMAWMALRRDTGPPGDTAA